MKMRDVKMKVSILFLIGFSTVSTVSAFLPRAAVRTSLIQQQQQHVSVSGKLHLFDPSVAVDTATTMMDTASSLFSSTNLMAFTDQGSNLAGTFFQASLLPYLLFLYFLSFRGNRISDLGNFGFQFVLLFVLSTIPSGVVCKSIYGVSLANVDWLHGAAETLLTVANVLIVLGFKEAMTNPEPAPMGRRRNIALATFGIFVLALATGTQLLGLEAHTQFLSGIGNLPADWTIQLPWIQHSEPENALSIPTWAIHFSSVFEYVFAMNLVWKYSESTGNPTWKGLTWGMLPLHASGICACTYHFFYNPSELQFLVTSQAGLTLLGNITLMIAAFRIARSNGWTLEEINPLPQSPTSPKGLVADGLAQVPLQLTPAQDSNEVLTLKLIAITLLASYGIKYGELGLDLPFTPNAPAAVAMIIGIPAITASYYYNESKQEDGKGISLSLPSFGGEEGKGLSMEDVKKYGVAGTVAYVLTELAFWIVAFPAAAYALYNTTGHWPDVINDNADRAAVLGFIFAGANIARAFVPIRLGAALALAPWVDENITNRGGSKPAEEAKVMETEQQQT